jgi:hypothetical protein
VQVGQVAPIGLRQGRGPYRQPFCR